MMLRPADVTLWKSGSWKKADNGFSSRGSGLCCAGARLCCVRCSREIGTVLLRHIMVLSTVRKRSAFGGAVCCVDESRYSVIGDPC